MVYVMIRFHLVMWNVIAFLKDPLWTVAMIGGEKLAFPEKARHEREGSACRDDSFCLKKIGEILAIGFTLGLYGVSERPYILGEFVHVTGTGFLVFFPRSMGRTVHEDDLLRGGTLEALFEKRITL